MIVKKIISKIFNKRNMRASDSFFRSGYRPGSNTEDQDINSGELYCRAIENADGVPFQLIFGTAPGEGYYVNVGKGIKKLLGISPVEFTERGFHSMIEKIVPLSEGLTPEVYESRRKFISGEVSSYKAEILIRMPEGELKWIQDSSMPLTDGETGKVIGAFGILFDINERKMSTDTLEREKYKAEESDRLKSAFLCNVSHEIRTPLNAIVGFSSLLCDNEDDPEKRREFMEIIYRSSDNLLHIMNNIVEISQIEANAVKIRKDVVNPGNMIRRAYEKFSAKAAENGISLSYTEIPDENDTDFLTDGLKVFEVLCNLLDNALKFTHTGEIKFGYVLRDDKIEFRVSDTGIGIKPELQPKIFTRFFQADCGSKRNYEGTGLGLAISKSYTEMLGGELWFTSKQGEGSVFYFTIPFERAEVKKEREEVK
jgi:signal transduction histidine kinase